MPGPGKRSPHVAGAVVFAVAIGVRVWVMLTLVPVEYLQPHTRWEAEAVAVSLATTGTFADPYAVPTGPTAHVAPVWPFVMSLVYRVVGLTTAAGYVTWVLGILAYATLFALLPWAGDRLGLGRPAGIVAGLAGALLWVWWPDPTQALAGIAMVLLLVALVHRWSGPVPAPRASLLLGLAGALALHVQPALLPVIVGCAAFELWWRRHDRAWAATGLLLTGLVVGCIPWTLRNDAALGGPVFVRSNLGLELRVAFHDEVHADLDLSHRQRPLRHPRTDPAEALRVRELGELAYMREARNEAVAWVAAHPGEAARLVGQRVLYFWFGPLHDAPLAAACTALTVLAIAGLVRRLPTLAVPQRAGVLIPLLTFPWVYYLLGAMTRYRIPLDWLVLLLAAGMLVTLAPSRPKATPDPS